MALTNFTAFKPVTGVLEGTPKEISFAQLKNWATGGNTPETAIIGKTGIQAFQITAPQLNSVLEYFDSASNGGGWVAITAQNITDGVWLSKTGVSIGSTPTLASAGNLNLRWTPAAHTNSLDNDGDLSTGQQNPAPITAFSAQAATSVDVDTLVGSAIELDADVIAINDAPTLTTITTFDGARSGQPFALKLSDLKANANEKDVDNVDAELTFKIDTIGANGDLFYGVQATPEEQTAINTDLASGIRPDGFFEYRVSPNIVWYKASAEEIEADTEITPDNVVIFVPDAGLPAGVPVTGFSVTAWDGQLESTTPVDVQFNIANDAPVIAPADVLVGLSEADVTFAFSSENNALITVNDANDDDLTVSLSVINGSLTIGTANLTFTPSTGGDGTDDAFMEFSGTEAAVTTALKTLTYTPAALGTPDDVLIINANDDVGSPNTGVAIPKVVEIVVGTPDNDAMVFDFVGGASSETVEWVAGDEPIEITSAKQFGTAKDIEVTVDTDNTNFVLKAVASVDPATGVVTYVKNDLDADLALTIGLSTVDTILDDDIIKFADNSSLQFNNTGASASLYGTSQMDHLIAGNSGDILRGYAGDDLLTGGDGRDALYGGNQNDVLNGGAGDDYISGGSGSDVINGGAGNDVLHGGSGNDDFVFGTNEGDDIILDFNKIDDELIWDTGVTGSASLDSGDTLVTLTDGGTIRLVGVSMTEGELTALIPAP